MKRRQGQARRLFFGLAIAMTMTTETLAETEPIPSPTLDETSVFDDGAMIDLGLFGTSSHVPLNALSPETLRTFVGVFDLVRNRYAKEIDDETLFRHAISGMLKQLDSHAEYLDATAFQNLQSFTEGGVADVGLRLGFDEQVGQWTVMGLESSSLAQGVGIAIGDYVHQIGDKKLDGTLSVDDVTQLLSGIAGTQVSLTFSHAGRSKQSVLLQRTNTKEQVISITIYDDVAVVKLPIFTDRTRHNLVEGLARINRPIKGLVLDVRNNPGGVLSSAIEVASLFVENSDVIQVVERNKVAQTLTTSEGSPLVNMPVVLLQNRYSASAAEVLAQALKNDKEALIVGEVSYGKVSIQSIFPIGHDEGIKLTTAYYQTPDGKKIDGIGIRPDIEMDFAGENWLGDVLKVLDERKLPVGIMIALPNDY